LGSPVGGGDSRYGTEPMGLDQSRPVVSPAPMPAAANPYRPGIQRTPQIARPDRRIARRGF